MRRTTLGHGAGRQLLRALPLACVQQLTPWVIPDGSYSLPGIAPGGNAHTRSMARKKSDQLPSVSPQDLRHHLDRLRPTPRGGWAWRCHYCNRYASSISLKGRFLCRSHGGVTQRQLDPLAKYLARQQGKKVPRPPGRPLKHGLYSRQPRVPVAQVLTEWRALRNRETK